MQQAGDFNDFVPRDAIQEEMSRRLSAPSDVKRSRIGMNFRPCSGWEAERLVRDIGQSSSD